MATPLEMFLSGKSSGIGIQKQQQALDQSRALAPAQLAISEQAVNSGASELESNQRQAELSEEREKLRFLNQASKALLTVPADQRAAQFERLRPLADRVGIDSSQFTPDQMTDENLTAAASQTEAFIQNPQSLRQAIEQQKIDLRERELTQRAAILRDEPRRKADIERQRLGAQIELKPQLERQVAESREVGKLGAQLQLQPGVSQAVENAKLQARQLDTISREQRSNARALNVYDVAMSGLVAALGGASTGVLGWLPAVTSDARIADGAIAAMAPVLKSLFRGAGEGTFTDKDQELLLAMVPTRRDDPAAQRAKFANIDAIIRAKLKSADQPAQSEASDTVSVGRFTVEEVN